MIQVGTITLVPVLSSSLPFAQWARSLVLAGGYDRLALGLPGMLEDALREAVALLPVIHAAVASDISDAMLFACAADPCDAMIEVLRLSESENIPCSCIAPDALREPEHVPLYPDPFVSENMGIEAYAAFLLTALRDYAWSAETHEDARAIACTLASRSADGTRILAFIHLRHFLSVYAALSAGDCVQLEMSKAPRRYDVAVCPIDPDTLYFALGEFPYLTGRYEANRGDLFAGKFVFADAIRELYSETRDRMLDSRDDIAAMSPARLSCALRFLRNLTVQDGALMPDVFDVVSAARGVGGDRFALKCLDQVKYYPYFNPLEERPLLRTGIGRARIGRGPAQKYVNLLSNRALIWQRIDLKPDPSRLRTRKYRYDWDPSSMCSHQPEDRRIELFNAHVRSKAQRVLAEDGARIEPFSVSMKDGIDIRETLRHWYDGKIYVREMPPARGNLDTVVIVFDGTHDDRYPHQVCWYAEHQEESTLTFYGTDPFSDLLGPGVARCSYGGLSLLFPPRSIPSVFELPEALKLSTHAHRLVYGALLFSAEKAVAFVAEQKPDAVMRRMASRMGKRLVWLPISTFSAETLAHLRRFHILNGHEVRSWASRFIGD